jgi:hypothetical protein
MVGSCWGCATGSRGRLGLRCLEISRELVGQRDAPVVALKGQAALFMLAWR